MASKSWIVAVTQNVRGAHVLPDAAILEAGKRQARHAELVAAGAARLIPPMKAPPLSGTETVVLTVENEKVGNCTVWAGLRRGKGRPGTDSASAMNPHGTLNHGNYASGSSESFGQRSDTITTATRQHGSHCRDAKLPTSGRCIQLDNPDSVDYNVLFRTARRVRCPKAFGCRRQSPAFLRAST